MSRIFWCVFFIMLSGCTTNEGAGRFSDDTPHRILREKYTCKSNVPDEVLKRANSYLTEKNQDSNESTLFSREEYFKQTKLINDYVSPRYLKLHNIERNTAHLNGYGGADEVLLCITAVGLEQYQVTSAISQVPNGWTKILRYKLIKENGSYYFEPPNAPTSIDEQVKNLQFNNTGMIQLWWIRQLEVVDELNLKQ